MGLLGFMDLCIMAICSANDCRKIALSFSQLGVGLSQLCLFEHLHTHEGKYQLEKEKIPQVCTNEIVNCLTVVLFSRLHFLQNTDLMMVLDEKLRITNMITIHPQGKMNVGLVKNDPPFLGLFNQKVH